MIAWLLNLIARWWFFRKHRLRANSPCPACGNRGGKLKCVIVEKKEKPNRTVMVEHTCNTCESKRYVPTLLPPEKWVAPELLADIQPAKPS